MQLKISNKNSEKPVTEHTTEKYTIKLSKSTSQDDFKDSNASFSNFHDNDDTDISNTTERSKEVTLNAEAILADKNISSTQADYNVSEITYNSKTWPNDVMTTSKDYTTTVEDDTTDSMDYPTIQDEITDSEDGTTEFYNVESTFPNDFKTTDFVTDDTSETNTLDYDYLSTNVEDKATAETTNSGQVMEMVVPVQQVDLSASMMNSVASSGFAESCKQWLEYGNDESKVYAIQPKENLTFNVFCDQETDGGGWIVSSLIFNFT